MTKNGGSAFPTGLHGTHMGGMSLRDYFAAKFMAAMAVKTFDVAHEADASPDEAGATLATISYLMADAMLAERAKVKP